MNGCRCISVAQGFRVNSYCVTIDGFIFFAKAHVLARRHEKLVFVQYVTGIVFLHCFRNTEPSRACAQGMAPVEPFSRALGVVNFHFSNVPLPRLSR